MTYVNSAIRRISNGVNTKHIISLKVRQLADLPFKKRRVINFQLPIFNFHILIRICPVRLPAGRQVVGLFSERKNNKKIAPTS
jgi:hypothetical protein